MNKGFFMKRLNQKGAFDFIIIIAIIAVLGIGGFVAWRVYDARQSDDSETTQEETTNDSNTSNGDEIPTSVSDTSTPDGWTSTSSATTSFTFYHPSDYTIDSDDVTLTLDQLAGNYITFSEDPNDNNIADTNDYLNRLKANGPSIGIDVDKIMKVEYNGVSGVFYQTAETNAGTAYYWFDFLDTDNNLIYSFNSKDKTNLIDIVQTVRFN